MKISVIGAGYVCLVSGICFADFGHNVICIDKDQKKIDQLNAGNIPIYEPGLDTLLNKNVQAKRLSFSSTFYDAVDQSDAVFIAVGTPSRRGDGSADLNYVKEAIEEVASEEGSSDSKKSKIPKKKKKKKSKIPKFKKKTN